jgi:cytoskeletal protein CcmA (bactofilin family)
MWNKRNEGDPRQAATAPPPSSPAATAAAPARTPDPPKSIAILGPSVVVKGDIRSEEDLTIEGEVTGLVEAIGYRLTIGPKGNLQTSGVKAREIIVMGKMKGSVEATEKVYIRRDAQLVGDVQTAGIVIEDGAYFKGGIDIRKGPPIKEA